MKERPSSLSVREIFSFPEIPWCRFWGDPNLQEAILVTRKLGDGWPLLFPAVCVLSGRHNKIPRTGWLKQQTISHSPRGGKSKIKVVSSDACLPGLYAVLFCLPLHLAFCLWTHISELSLPSSPLITRTQGSRQIIRPNFNLIISLKILSANIYIIVLRGLSPAGLAGQDLPPGSFTDLATPSPRPSHTAASCWIFAGNGGGWF